MDRRTFMKGSLLSAIPLPFTVFAGDYPERVIKIVNPYAPGGALDTLARIIAQKLQNRFGQSVIVENKTGAGGNIGADMVAKSPPDGYTLVMASSATHGSNQALYGSLMAYDPVKDFSMVAVTAMWGNILVVNPALPARSLPELVALAKSKPGQLTFGSSAQGGSPHMAGELLKAKAGIDLLHVPYKGGAPAMLALLSGEVNMNFSDVPGAMPHVRSGKLRALGVTTAKRSTVMPEVPTFAEQGYPDFDLYSWNGVAAPAGTPRSVIEKLSEAILEVMRHPDVRERLLGMGVEPLGLGAAESDHFMRESVKRWTEVVRISGAKLPL